MSNENELRRRTLIGSLVAATVGKTLGVGAARSEQDGDDGEIESQSNHKDVEDYANRAGRITHEGLDQTFEDHKTGVIDDSTRDAVRDAWQSGDRVVDKDVRTISENVVEDTTLTPDPDGSGGDDVVYRVTSNITINNAVLAVEPGVVIEFEEGTKLNFQNGSRCLIQGSARRPILLTGTYPVPGWWDGIYFESEDSRNEMSQVIVEYGGNSLDGNVELGTGTGDEPKLAIDNCTLRLSDGFGLNCGKGVTLTEADLNLYTRNGDAPVSVYPMAMSMLSGESDFTGNRHDYVRVDSRNGIGGAGPDTDTRSWDALDVPWRIVQGKNIRIADVELVVRPGTVVEFAENSGLNFRDARITMEGTATDTITFTGTEKERGWWNGIYSSSENTGNVMENVLVEYGGSDLRGNLEVATGTGDAGHLEIRNCTFRDANGFGLYAGGPTDFPNTGDNAYVDNSDGSISTLTRNLHEFGEGSTFSNGPESKRAVEVRKTSVDSSDLEPGEEAIVWGQDSDDVPYDFEGDAHFVDEVELKILPGTTIRFGLQGKLSFEEDAQITIDGTEDAPIRLTGTEETPGWWNGIYSDSSNPLNIIDHAVVEYGGNVDGNLDGQIEMGTNTGTSAQMSITNSTIANSAKAGLYVDDDSRPRLENVTFSNNAGGGYVVDE